MKQTTNGKGARFLSADLHIHTPASHDYADKSASAEQFVASLLAADLDIAAVTDHNSAEWVDAVRSAARGKPIAIFPGVEITTPHCHILAIFDPATTKSTIDDLLTEVGIKTVDRGNKDALAKQPEEVLAAIRRAGGLGIAAHANSSNGLLKHPKGQYKLGLCRRADLFALEFSDKADVENFCAGKVSQYPAKACLQGSDAHALAEIGRRRSYLKMDSVSIWGLEQALHDYRVRTRFSWNLVTERHPYIKALVADQGFLAQVPFEFNEGLNCLVGGKGAGKSTAIELLRFAFADKSVVPEIHEEHQSKIDALLGEGGAVQVSYVDSDGVDKVVERSLPWDSERRVRTSDGAAADLLTRPVFFSQGELTQIARERPAQLDLIDRYVDVARDHAEERAAISELRANAAEVARLSQATGDIDEEVADRNTGLAATKQKYADLERTLKEPILTEFPAWESEDRYLTEAKDALDGIEEEMQEAIAGVEIAEAAPGLDRGFPNHSLLKSIPGIFGSLQKVSDKLMADFAKTLRVKRAEIDAVRKTWTPRFQSKKRAYEKALLKIGNDDIRQAQNQLRGLKKRLDELERKSKGQATTHRQLENLRTARDGLLARLIAARHSRFSKRRDKSAAWVASFKGKIRVTIVEAGDRSAYIALLRQMTRGAMLRDSDLDAVTSSITPDELVRQIEARDAADIAARTGLKLENARKLVDAVGAKPIGEQLNIATVTLADEPDIQYEAQPGKTRGLAQLSAGQKATVIISLALIEGRTPLVVDQPEEPLDTLAISDPVVETLRSQKDFRQFIFTTHNANIAVGGDAELNIVLEAGADRASIKSLGGVDEPGTNDLLVLHLEGGPDALKRRFGKYRQQSGR